MPVPFAPHDLAALPPGLSAWPLDAEATLSGLLGDAPGTDDVVDPSLFGALGEIGSVTVRIEDDDDFEPAVFPQVATSGGVLAALYSIPLEQAWALLPATERLVPVRVTPRRAAISFFAT